MRVVPKHTVLSHSLITPPCPFRLEYLSYHGIMLIENRQTVLKMKFKPPLLVPGKAQYTSHARSSRMPPPNTKVFSFPYISEIVFAFQSGICLTSLTRSWLRSYSVANSLIWASLSFGVLLFGTDGLQDTP